jgi:hypothetical protein
MPFPELEPMTSWSQDNSFTAALGLPFKGLGVLNYLVDMIPQQVTNARHNHKFNAIGRNMDTQTNSVRDIRITKAQMTQRCTFYSHSMLVI